jgi:chloramphenicol 3-O phosphotransferase
VAGKVILLNGASSAGKSTLCRALQAALPEPFWHVSFDKLREADVLPLERVRAGDFVWAEMRETVFDGFHRSLPAYAGAGANLIVEHIVETLAWRDRLLDLLGGQDVFFVGVHCPLEELERREAARGDRRAGEARRDFETCHLHMAYDVEVDSREPPEANSAMIIAAWTGRRRPGAFERLQQERA